jgi:undecaprenyl-diphosphatase
VDSAISLTLHDTVAGQPLLAAVVVLLADNGVFLLPIALVVTWVVAKPRAPTRRAIVAGCVAAVLAICLGLVLERTLARPRPFVALDIAPLITHVADSSFPSDHTLTGVALVTPLALRMPRIGVWLLAWALLVGMARVAASLHYPSDILGSALLAMALGVIGMFFVDRTLGKWPESARARLDL